MKDKRGKWIIVGILVLTALFFSLYFDKEIVKFFSLFRNEPLDKVFMFVTFVSSEIIVSFVLTTLFLWREHKRKWIAPLWVSLALVAVISFIIKVTVQRDRPFQLGIVPILSSLQEASFSTWNWSFLSFQTALGFCAIPILNKEFPKLKKFWIAFAIIIGISRIYFGLHFMSDVISGGILGYLIGIIILKVEEEHKFGEKIYNRIMRK